MKQFLGIDDVQSAHFTADPPSFALRRPKVSGRKAEGLRFEAKAQNYLMGLSDFYLPSPWIIYIREGRPYWCQPDGIELDYRRGIITIVEIKYSHTPEAYRQLKGVYEPVIRAMFRRPSWGVRLVELVKWYDPDVRFPEPIVMCPNPLKYDKPQIGVHVWRPE